MCNDNLEGLVASRIKIQMPYICKDR